jgi:hypothetical protein
MCVLSCCNTDVKGLEGFSDSGVSNSIIRCGRFFDEPRLEGFKLLHVFNSLWDVPDL